jgi:hypothetical protein
MYGERRLETHDVCFPISQANRPERMFRVMVLSSADTDAQAVDSRMERLYHLNGGTDAIIVFLVSRARVEEHDQLRAFMQLSVKSVLLEDRVSSHVRSDPPLNSMLEKFEAPMVPRCTAEALPSTLRTMQHRLSSTPTGPPVPTSTRVLLSQCVHGLPRAESQTNILSGIVSSSRDLASKADCEEGRQLLRDYLGDIDGERVISFLTHDVILN